MGWRCGVDAVDADPLFQVSPLDTLTYTGGAPGLVAAAELASHLRRFAPPTSTPVEALRAE